MTAILEATDLVKTYRGRAGPRSAVGSVRAVDGLSFSLFEGETLGIVGESGSGKSTVGRMVLGLLRPDEGRIRYQGEDVVDLRGKVRRAWLRSAQMIFQDPYSTLPHHMTVGRILDDPFRIHRVRRPDRPSAQSLLSEVELPPDYARRYPHQLSGGERQRVVIARALALRPRLLVCDEAVSALDVSVQGRILQLLQDLQVEHRLTFLFISHDLGVVRRMCDRVCVMQAGRVVEAGPTDQVYADPQHDYTRHLLAAVPRISRLGRYRRGHE